MQFEYLQKYAVCTKKKKMVKVGKKIVFDAQTKSDYCQYLDLNG